MLRVQYSLSGWRISAVGAPPPLGHGKTVHVCSEENEYCHDLRWREQQRSQLSAKLGLYGASLYKLQRSAN